VRTFSTQFKGFGPLHNEAAGLALHDWILSLDSDEVITTELCQEIAAVSLDESCVYSVSMHNFFNGKWVRCCGWYPDDHVRLYNRKRTGFTDAQVHEEIISSGLRIIALRAPVEHYSYTSISDFLTKTQRYSDLFAQQNQGKIRSSVLKALTHGFGAFLRSYLVKYGFLGGREGLVISMTSAFCSFYKYMKLLEANEKLVSNVVAGPAPKERTRLKAVSSRNV
jgi:hypothetical protein